MQAHRACSLSVALSAGASRYEPKASSLRVALSLLWSLQVQPQRGCSLLAAFSLRLLLSYFRLILLPSAEAPLLVKVLPAGVHVSVVVGIAEAVGVTITVCFKAGCVAVEAAVAAATVRDNLVRSLGVVHLFIRFSVGCGFGLSTVGRAQKLRWRRSG